VSGGVADPQNAVGKIFQFERVSMPVTWQGVDIWFESAPENVNKGCLECDLCNRRMRNWVRWGVMSESLFHAG
jgi:hypothetical protein